MADTYTGMRGIPLAPPPTTPAARRRWLIARRHVLGASDVAKVLGLAPPTWGSPLDVWLEKTSPDVVDKDMGERVRWGLRLERPIVDEYRVRHAEDRGVYVAPSPGLLRHEEHYWLSATPDRVLLDRATKRTALGLLEIKNADWSKERDWEDGVPFHIQIQTQVQMGVTGTPFVDVVPLFGGNKMPEPHRVEFDPIAWHEIVQITGAWWRGHVEAGIAPAPMVGDIPNLNKVWPGAEGTSVYLDDDLVAALRRRDSAKRLMGDLKRETDEIELTVKALMGDATAALWQPVDDDGEPVGDPVKVASWTRSTQKYFEQSRLEEEKPDLAAEYTTRRPSQRFTVHKSIHNTPTEEE